MAQISRPRAALLAALLLAGAAAQSASQSPYAGQQEREIKALSSAEVRDLLAGKGMGLAKAAELNGYPGPAHVLALAPQLHLSREQEAKTRALHARMEADAKASGTQLVEAERELDALFRSRSATPQRLADALQKVASHQARVRQVHLQAHLDQVDLLSPQQVARYNALRGYAGAAGGSPARDPAGGHGHHGPHGQR